MYELLILLSLNLSECLCPSLFFVRICGAQAKIVDESGELVERGEKGELCIRGYNVMLCYWDDPQQTNKAIKQDRWYSTG